MEKPNLEQKTYTFGVIHGIVIGVLFMYLIKKK